MKTQRETPEWLAIKMVNLMMNEDESIEYNQSTILEPSCGNGKIIQEIESFLNCPIIGVELNKELSEESKKKFEDNNKIVIKNNNFLDVGIDLIRNNKIRHVIMLPPFKNMVFIEHINLVLEAWKTFSGMYDEYLISLVHNGFWTDNSELCVNFRKTINSKYDVSFIPIPDNTFMEKGKSVPCSIMVLTH